MPLVPQSDYFPSFVFKNRHLNTIYPNLLRSVSINYSRKRIFTPDNDFLDLDFSIIGSDKIAVVLHGLEGSTDRAYMKGISKHLNIKDIDVCAVNMRGCGGELNRLFSSYHSGKTDDLKYVLDYIKANHKYDAIYLIGFSLGGNIMLKYLGEEGTHSFISKAVAISVPCDLEASAIHLKKHAGKIYINRLIKSLKGKIKLKIKAFPNEGIRLKDIDNINDFHQFDDLYTAPVHGFKNAKDYWSKCSSIGFMNTIKVPTLLINAQDDPFLPNECYPYKEAEKSEFLFLEAPNYGGHVGFCNDFLFQKPLWHEKRCLDFITSL